MCILRAMQDLKTYRQALQETQGQFGKRIGVSQGMVCRLETGQVKPGLDLAVEIERATNGAVPVEVWVDAPEVEA